MLNITTQAAIAVLQDISLGNCLHWESFSMSNEELSLLLCKLEAGKLIRPLLGKEGNGLFSYELTRPLFEISLLDVLQSLDAPINCNRPTSEAFYHRHGLVSQRIGVINHMTRLFLSETKLTDW